MKMRTGGIVIFLLAASWLGASALAQETPHLLADINRSPYVPFSFMVHEEPADFFNLGGRLFFSTADPGSLDPAILWSTDGTAEGTRQVSSALCRSDCQSIPALGVVNGAALLGVTFSSEPSRLARTDGTPGGTYLLDGEFDFNLKPQVFFLPGSGVLLIPTCVSAPYCSLWRSDTTRAGTGPFLGTDGLPFLAPQAFSFWRGRLYFVAVHGGGGESGLWSTDGTPAGTLFLHAVGELDGRSVRTVATASHLFFTAGDTGEDLWVTDGSPAGTLRLADFDPQASSDFTLPAVASMTASGDRVYFETHRAGHAIEIWESDGTPQGTRPRIELPARLVEAAGFERVGGHWLFVATTDRENPAVFWTVDDGFSRAARLIACDGGTCPSFYVPLSPPGARREIFVGSDNLNGYDPWVTDGTAAGTRRLADLCGEYCSDSLWPDAASGVAGPGGALLFHVFMPRNDLGTREDELWRTDGTPEGTRRIAEHVDGFGLLNGIVYYGSSGGAGHLGSELWATDGSAGNAHRVASLRRFEPGSAPVFQPFRDGALILTAKVDGQSVLWHSDGTTPGTFPVHHFSSDTQRVYPSFIGPPGSLQFLLLDLRATNPNRQDTYELWRTDGTAAGTWAIQKLSPSDFITPPIAWRGRLVFGRGSAGSCALWSSDGTEAGTHQILPAASLIRCPQPLTPLGSDFLYSVPNFDPKQTSPLFRSDGTAAGTREIARFGGFVADPLLAGGTVFFRVVSDTSNEIWQTDGTAAGTHRTTTLADPSDLQEFEGSLYLTAALSADHDAGRALFRLPLSGGPPIQLAKLFPYSESRFFVPVQLTPVGDRLLFTVQNFLRGLELWATDGTPEGTRRLRSFQPTPDFNSQPAILAGAGDRVFFPAEDGMHGWELWESDGTREGTRMVIDLAPGGFSSLPFFPQLAVAKRFLFFAADDGKTGLESWALPLAP